MKDARAILRFRFPKGAPKGVEFPLTCDLFYLFSSEREKNRN